MDANAIIGAVNSVTSKWAKQRKAEERNARAKSRRRHAMISYRETSIKDYVFQVHG